MFSMSLPGNIWNFSRKRGKKRVERSAEARQKVERVGGEVERKVEGQLRERLRRIGSLFCYISFFQSKSIYGNKLE